MKSERVILMLFFLILTPLSSSAVSFSEIAWMGTDVSANDEWIELFNNGAETISLDGWKIETLDGGLNVSLSGSISPGAFFLLERTDDATIPSVTADFIYTGALGNDGETLILKNANGDEIDKVGASSGWPAGDNSTKDTMQNSSGLWITASPTPKAQNKSVSQQVQSGGVGATSSSSGGVNAESPLYTAIEKVLIITEEKSFIQGAEVSFVAEARNKSGKKISNATYTWSFGDGAIGTGEFARHTFLYPGNYTVSVRAFAEGDDALAKIVISIFEPQLSLSAGIRDDSTYVSVKNNGTFDIDLVNMKLIGESSAPFIFPRDTIVPKGGEVIFPQEITRVFAKTKVSLFDARGKELAFFHEGATTPEVSENEKKAVITENTSSSRNNPQAFVSVTSSFQSEAEHIDPGKGDVLSAQGALAASFEVEQERGFLSAVSLFPKKIFDFFKRVLF